MLAHISDASATESGFVAILLPYTTMLCQYHRKQKRHPFRVPLAEAVGFEPTVPKRAQLISSQSRYDHFDTLPFFLLHFDTHILSVAC